MSSTPSPFTPSSDDLEQQDPFYLERYLVHLKNPRTPTFPEPTQDNSSTLETQPPREPTQKPITSEPPSPTRIKSTFSTQSNGSLGGDPFYLEKYRQYYTRPLQQPGRMPASVHSDEDALGAPEIVDTPQPTTESQNSIEGQQFLNGIAGHRQPAQMPAPIYRSDSDDEGAVAAGDELQSPVESSNGINGINEIDHNYPSGDFPSSIYAGDDEASSDYERMSISGSRILFTNMPNGAYGILNHGDHESSPIPQVGQHSGSPQSLSSSSLAGSGDSLGDLHDPVLPPTPDQQERHLRTYAWIQTIDAETGRTHQRAASGSNSPFEDEDSSQENLEHLLLDSAVASMPVYRFPSSKFKGKSFSEPADAVQRDQEHFSNNTINTTRPDGEVFESVPIFSAQKSPEPLFIIKDKEKARYTWRLVSHQLLAGEQKIDTAVSRPDNQQKKPMSEYQKQRQQEDEEKFIIVYPPTDAQYTRSMKDEGCIYLGENSRYVYPLIISFISLCTLLVLYRPCNRTGQVSGAGQPQNQNPKTNHIFCFHDKNASSHVDALATAARGFYVRWTADSILKPPLRNRPTWDGLNQEELLTTEITVV